MDDEKALAGPGSGWLKTKHGGLWHEIQRGPWWASGKRMAHTWGCGRRECAKYRKTRPPANRQCDRCRASRDAAKQRLKEGA